MLSVCCDFSIADISCLVVGRMWARCWQENSSKNRSTDGTSLSTSKSTNYLINNDASSTTAKNKKALDLGVTIITEQEFIEKFSLDF